MFDNIFVVDFGVVMIYVVLIFLLFLVVFFFS